MKGKNTRTIRIHSEDGDILKDICAERWNNRRVTLEKRFPAPAKIVKLALRQPNLRKALGTLPAMEDKR